jgi:DNA-binding NarL/FixJ family response regulator
MVFVLIVSSVRVVREALARSLEEHVTVRVLGTAGSRQDALRRTADLGPDVLLVDTSALGGVALACALSQAAAGVKVVALGCSEQEADVMACAEAGVSAFVEREATFEDVIAATTAVTRGETACTPQVAAMLLRRVADGARTRRRGTAEVGQLTAREREIVALVDEGLSNKEIALRLSIELSTVKNHVHNVLEKLGARGRSEAAARLRTVSS